MNNPYFTFFVTDLETTYQKEFDKTKLKGGLEKCGERDLKLIDNFLIFESFLRNSGFVDYYGQKVEGQLLF